MSCTNQAHTNQKEEQNRKQASNQKRSANKTLGRAEFACIGPYRPDLPTPPSIPPPFHPFTFPLRLLACSLSSQSAPCSQAPSDCLHEAGLLALYPFPHNHLTRTTYYHALPFSSTATAHPHNGSNRGHDNASPTTRPPRPGPARRACPGHFAAGAGRQVSQKRWLGKRERFLLRAAPSPSTKHCVLTPPPPFPTQPGFTNAPWKPRPMPPL